MRSIETTDVFALSAVKPIERLDRYRRFSLEAVRQALSGATRRRERSPVADATLEPAGSVEGLEYSRCPVTGSFFLTQLPDWKSWKSLLQAVNQYRRSPEAFHLELSESRSEKVYWPKVEWIQSSLRLQGIQRPKILEVCTPPSAMLQLLQESGLFSEVFSLDEMELAHGEAKETGAGVEAALLLESLDRLDDPVALLEAVSKRLAPGGLLFVTGLVASGFDFAVLGLRHRYWVPPDRTNCFSRIGLQRLLEQAGFTLVEVSTPGVLDVEIVQAHCKADPALAQSNFERQVVQGDDETRAACQSFLQQGGLSSFARIVAKKEK